MSPTRLLGAVAAAALPLAAAACVFSASMVMPESSDGQGGAGGADTTSDTGSASSSSGGAGGEMSGASSSSSSTSSSTSSGGTDCKTDEDQDGAISAECSGGTDCADQDFNAHPEPPTVSFQSAPIKDATLRNTLPFDFNCDGQETGETLVLYCQSGCFATKLGYQAPVKCGESALVGHCEVVSCQWKAESPSKNQVQRCK